MWRLTTLALIALLCCTAVFAQSTTTSGQITDAGAQAWNNGTFSFVFVPNPQFPVGPYTWTGGTLNTTISGSLNATGGYSVSIPSNSSISPQGSKWTATFCPQASSPCFQVQNVAITGGTQTINATPPAILINLQLGVPPILAYSTSEVTGAVIGSQFYLLGTGQQICNAVSGNTCTTWVAVGGGNGIGSSAATSGVFNLANYGAIDDDSTDNCSGGTNAVALFTAAVNGFSGTGVPIAIIPSGASNKAYKLATNANACAFSFTRAGGVTVQLWGNIDCAQTATFCMGFGQSGQVAEQAKENYRLEGTGTFLGGANLTTAGVYIQPGVLQFHIHGIQFGVGNTGSAVDGFGATNATLGNCTNYSIFVDAPVASGYIDHVFDFVASSSTSVGGCGMANPSGSGTGSNTIFYESNIVATGGAIAGGTQCGSTGILDGGTLGVSSNNNVYGFGMPWRIQGIGHRLVANQVDAAGCTAKGVSAAFHIGASGSATAITNLTFDSNIAQISPSGHTANLIAIAGDSTATITAATIIGNQNNVSGTGSLFPSTVTCTPSGQPCQVYGNQGFAGINPGLSGNTGTGWGAGEQVNIVFSPAVQSANLGSTSMGNATIGHSGFLWCTVVETVRDATSSTLPSCVASYTDQISGVAATQTVTATNSSNVVGAAQSGFIGLSVAAGNAINISTTGYASNVAGTMKYQLQAFFVQY